MQWGMIIDLKRCTGCHACAVACKQEHSTPSGIHFRRVEFDEVGEYPDAKRLHAPVQCNHCEDPPCVPVCPTEATYKREEDGLVLVDDDHCIGCSYCIEACPYEHRHFVEGKMMHFDEGFTPAEELGGKAGHDWQAKRNTVVKCTFCEHRLKYAAENDLTPGVDRDATPSCVITCPAQAMHFGDVSDPEGPMQQLIRERDGFTLLPEAETRPSIYYLPDN